MNLWIDVDCLMFFHAFQFPFGGAASFFLWDCELIIPTTLRRSLFHLGFMVEKKQTTSWILMVGYKFSKPTHITGL